MARGTTLGQLVTMLRAECGHSVVAALGENMLPALQQTLRRTQELLWNDHPWPHLKIRRDEELQAGERYYSFDPDLSFDRVSDMQVTVKYAGTWRPVVHGIGPAQFNARDSDLDERDDPVVRWQHYESDQYEVWPIPASNDQTLRMEGVKKLSALTANGDRADLDDMLIVLFAAAEILARQKSADAQAKAAIAQKHYATLKGQQSKTGMFINGGGVDPTMHRGHRPAPIYGRKI